MPRPMSGAMLSAIQASALYPIIFVQMQFVTGTVYMWTGSGTISWNGQTWAGVGSLGNISTIDDNSTVEAKGVTLTLSGIDSGLLADIVQEFQIGAPVLVYLGLYDVSTSPPNLISSPITSWAGRMDQPTVDVGGTTATITIACENRLIEMNVAVDRRYCQADQSIDYPGDLAFQFVAGVQEQQISWGRIPTPTTGPFAGITLSL